VKLHTQVKDYSSLKLFDLRSESGHSGLLYQILYKCDLPGEGSPDKKRQSTTTKVFLKTTFTRKITLKQGM